jgi:hypothetical protein
LAFFGLTRSEVLESRLGVPPSSVESISAVIGPLPTHLSNGQAGAITIRSKDGSGPIAGSLSYETDEPFGPGASVGLNRLEGRLAGSVAQKLSFFATGLLQGQESVGSGFDADDAPIFVQTDIDTTVAVPSAFGDPFADTTFVEVQRYTASQIYRPSSLVSVYQMLGKLTYEFGSGSRLSLLGIAGQNQNRNFEYGTLYNPAGATGNRTSSGLLGLTWQQRLNGSTARPLALNASLSVQYDRERSGPLSLEEERNTTDPFGGFLVRPLDLRFDFDNFPVDEELLRNYRTNLPGSRRSPYDLENTAQYALIDRYRNNAYGLYNRFFVTFPESGGPVGLLTLYKENRTVATADLSWQLNRSHQLHVGGEFTRYSIDNYSHFLESQLLSDVYLENPSRLGVFLQDRIQFGPAFVTAGVRYDSYETGARRPPEFPRISSHPAYDPNDPDAFFTNDALFAPDERHSRVTPHVLATFSVSPRTTFRGSVAQQVQVPDFRLVLASINTDLAITNGSQVFGQDLNFERSDIFELGVRHTLADNLSVDLALYARDVKSDVSIRLASRFDPLSGTNRDLWVLTNDGNRRVRGVDLKVERGVGDWLSGWLGYSYQDAKSDIMGVGPLSVPAADSRPHSVSGAIALTTPEDWKPGSLAGTILRNVGLYTQLRLASGTPYTRCSDLLDVIVLSPDVCFGALLDPINGERLPMFKQLDMRLTKRFGPGGRFTGYIDARNVLNFRNVLAVFAVNGSTSNPTEAAMNWASDSADVGSEAEANGRYRVDGSIDLGQALPDPRVTCATWTDQAGNPSAPNCVYLIRAEERFGNGDHVFDLAEQRRASEALYRVLRGPQELTGPPRRIRVGLEASF